MNLNRFFAGAIVGGAAGGALASACGAMAGATGAAILNAAGYKGYMVGQAAKMGATGSAIFGGIIGAGTGALASRGIFSHLQSGESFNYRRTGVPGVSYTANVVLGGLIGYGVMNAAGATVMELGKTAAAFAVGGAVTVIPAACVLASICVPLVLLHTASFREYQEIQESPPPLARLF